MALHNQFRQFLNPPGPSDDVNVPCPYVPLHGSAAAPDCNRRRPATVVLLLIAGLLGVALFTVLVVPGNGVHREMSMEMASNSRGSHPGETRWQKRMSPMARGVAEGVSAKSFWPSLLWSSSSFLSSPPHRWTAKALAWQRTAFHFQPIKNWMNDPNGPLLHKGWYHFFYQYNPYGAVWGNIVWGHAVSRDLIHWRHLPIAMVPDLWYDINGVWTGSATMLDDGQIAMLYTGSTNESVQVQNLAFPADPTDPLLIDWVKYPGNPVLVPPPDILPMDFRDPTTAWLTPEGMWRLIIGSKVNNTGISLVYDTEDFKTYKLLDTAFRGVQGTGMWECVDFYPVSKTTENGLDTSVNGPGVKHVMKTSLDDDRNDYYALGTYDLDVGTWTPDDPKLDVGIGLRYDYGVFYASKTFYDQENRRRILWGWIKETDSEEADIQKGWASLQAIPRTILFDQKTGNNILKWPVKEVETLRLSKMAFDKVDAGPGSVLHLDVGSASQLDIEAEFEVYQEVMNDLNGTDTNYTCANSGGAARRGALGPFGLLVHTDRCLAEKTPIYFYIHKDTQGNSQVLFCTDLSGSSEARDVDKAIYGSSVSVLQGEKLSMRILVDHSIVESFAQGGRTCVTSRVYPTKAIYREAKIFLFNNATDATITASIKIWQMSPAYAHS